MINYIILGMVQGLTEFFPVSSSAHLVISGKILGVTQDAVSVSVVLHLGTTFALILFFFKDSVRLWQNKRLLSLIIMVTAITGIIGIAGKDFFESLFASTRLIGFALLVTGSILILTRRFMQAKRNSVKIKDAVTLGITQAISIIPGISRSGITISTLLFRGLDRETSFRFSFLASIPAVLGALVLESKKIGFVLNLELMHLLAGFLSSFCSGIFSLWLLKAIMRRAKWHYFGYYCILLAIITLIFIK